MNNLRMRLVLWTVALEAVLLIMLAGFLVWFLQNSETRRLNDILRLSATQLNAVIDVNNGRYFVESEETADLQARGITAWILTSDGQPALTLGAAPTASLPQPTPAPDQMIDTTLPDGTPVRLLTTYLQDEEDHPLGTMILAVSLADSRDSISQILAGVGLAIPVVLLLSAAGGLFLAGRALAPVSAMTTTARQISAADLSRRLAFDLPDDEIGRLAQTFNAMLDRLEQAFQRERQFTADASHELRTPLGLLKTQLSLARSRPRDNDTLRQMMADMEGDVDRLTRLVEQMLTLARIEEGATVPLEPVALDALLADLVQQYQAKALAGQHQLTFDDPPRKTNWQVVGNIEQLQQVFANLIDNALKYTPAGGQVEVSLSRNWQQFTVTVADNGPGIAPEHLPHLFKRFYRVDSARTSTSGGVGLGLAITQAIVQAHHGAIDVASQPGQGTSFRVNLPAPPPLLSV